MSLIKNIAFKMDPKEIEKLKKITKAYKISMSEFIRHAINNYILYMKIPK